MIDLLIRSDIQGHSCDLENARSIHISYLNECSSIKLNSDAFPKDRSMSTPLDDSMSHARAGGPTTYDLDLVAS